jgi:ribosome-associated toxin RatA of RatAB toxin-antitoxin module
MREVRHSALVSATPGRMFALINDIESYPAFVPGCTSAAVLSRSEDEIVASLAVRRGALKAEFTTRNRLEPDRRIVMQLVQGPFRELEGEWLLTPIGENGCRVELRLRFAFSNPISGMMFEPMFAETATSLVDAFVARSRAVPT